MGLTEERPADERLQFGAASSAIISTSAGDQPVARQRTPPWRPASSLLAVRVGSFPAGLRRAFEREREHGNLFLFVPVFLAGGALAYFSLPGEPGFTGLLLAAGLLGVLALWAAPRPLLRAVALAGLVTTGGMLAAKVETWRTGTQMLGSEITTQLVARVVRIENQASGRVRLTLDIISTQRPVLRYAPDRVRATARAVPAGLRPGDTIAGVVRLMPASGPLRPHSYDFSFYSYFNGIGAVGFFLSGPWVKPVAEAPPWRAASQARIESWRSQMADRITSRIGGPEGFIAAALITGIRAGIPEEINEALRIVGLYHVISISGLHMALVGGTVMVALRAGFALAPAFASRRPVKKYAAAVALAATAFYLFISGADIAAQRSFMMLGVMLVAILFDRAALTMRNLAISAVIILIIAPHEVVGPSFQMSFAATAALVAAYAAWTAYRERRAAGIPPRRGPVVAALRTGVKYAGGLSMTSIVAGTATALFTAWHFQQVSPLGLIANLAAMPFVSVVVMPMAVLAALLMPIGLDGVPLQAMGLGISAMNAIAIWLAQRSAFDATGAIPLSAVLFLTAALAILTMSGSRLRWAAAPLLLAGIMLLLTRELPDLLVSEDARLVALRLSDGSVAVNRSRPREFVIGNWRRALDASDLVRPRKGEPHEVEMDTGFLCDKRVCIARWNHITIAHTQDAQAALDACAYARIIIIDDATIQDRCAGRALVLTKRDLARRGSAEISMRSGRIATRFAIEEPYRPWHEHRRFSREARGLGVYKRAQKEGDG